MSIIGLITASSTILLQLTPWLALGIVIILAAWIVVRQVRRKLSGQPTGCAKCSKTNCQSCPSVLLREMEDADAKPEKAVPLK